MNKKFIPVITTIVIVCLFTITEWYVLESIYDTKYNKFTKEYVETLSNVQTELKETTKDRDSLQHVTDSISITLESYHSYLKDLINENDSLEDNNETLKYKLERIDYYNGVAAKGNNIKYLRGWINRIISK